MVIVQYVWPEHLRYQTEKQRLIWGYKILFLDVLFPLHLKRIIYVDADQIVQGDLAALWQRSLEGAPVAMTPFCRADPNTKTTGFRFWESGFWSSTLGEQPYHISALFVADLEAFRSLREQTGQPEGVGDIYRRTYQALTADPNSLSNLDQVSTSSSLAVSVWACQLPARRCPPRRILIPCLLVTEPAQLTSLTFSCLLLLLS